MKKGVFFGTLVIAIGVLTVMRVQNMGKTGEIRETASQNTVSVSPTPTTTIVQNGEEQNKDRNTLLTYSNKELGIEFRYPAFAGEPSLDETDTNGNYITIKFDQINLEVVLYRSLEGSIPSVVCTKPGVVQKDKVENGSISVCQNIKTGDKKKTVLATTFVVPECSPDIYSSYTTETGSKIFPVAEINYTHRSSAGKLAYNCADETKKQLALKLIEHEMNLFEDLNTKFELSNDEREGRAIMITIGQTLQVQ